MLVWQFMLVQLFVGVVFAVAVWLADQLFERKYREREAISFAISLGVVSPLQVLLNPRWSLADHLAARPPARQIDQADLVARQVALFDQIARASAPLAGRPS